MFKDLLPIGSIVVLREGIRSLMVVGYKVAKKNDPDILYDYIGVLYPEGFVGEQGHLLFNHNDINNVIFKGYSNPEREDFIRFMDEAYEKEAQSKETE